MGIFIILLCAVAVLILCYFIAKEFENIAKMKGYNSKKYFWWTFWLTPYGIAMVIALPDRKSTVVIDEKRENVEDELPSL